MTSTSTATPTDDSTRGTGGPSGDRVGLLGTLVIVADTDGEAIGIYRRLGFADVERQLMMEKRSGEWASLDA